MSNGYSAVPNRRRGARLGASAGLMRYASVITALLLVTSGCSGGGGERDEESETRRATTGGAAKPAEPRSSRWTFDYLSTSRDASVFDIAAASADEGWALGLEQKEDGDDAYVMLHRRGTTWRPAEMPIEAPRGAVLANTALEASGPDNVWLFATLLDGDSAYGSPEAVRWDGRRWQRVPNASNIADAVVLAPDDVWTLSMNSPVAKRWDGESWTMHSLPFEAEALSASGPDDVWAAGYVIPPGGDVPQPEIMRFDGKTWQSTEVPRFRQAKKPKPEEHASISEIVAISSDEAWAFGSHSYTSGPVGSVLHETTFVLHWDGSRWQKVPDALDDAVDIHPYPAMAATADGTGGFVLGGEQHRTADGSLYEIHGPKPVAGRSKGVTDADRRQRFEVSDLQLVPGTHQIWAAGYVSLERSNDANFMRGAVATYNAGG